MRVKNEVSVLHYYMRKVINHIVPLLFLTSVLPWLDEGAQLKVSLLKCTIHPVYFALKKFFSARSRMLLRLHQHGSLKFPAVFHLHIYLQYCTMEKFITVAPFKYIVKKLHWKCFSV